MSEWGRKRTWEKLLPSRMWLAISITACLVTEKIGEKEKAEEKIKKKIGISPI